MMDNLKKYNYAFCFIICTAYQLLFYKYGLNLWDEGDLAYGALRVLNGQIPLIDFGHDGYPPGRYVLSALFFKIFGTNLLSIRLLFVLLTSLVVILLYTTAKNIMNKNFAFIASLLLLSAPSMYYSRFFPICTIINIYFVARYINSYRKFDLLLAIFIILLTLLIKLEIGLISFIVLSIVFVLQAFYSREKISINFKSLHLRNKILVSMAICFLVLLLTAAFKINLPSKLNTFVFQMNSTWGNPFPSFFSSSEKRFLPWKELFDVSLFYMPILVYISTIILLLKRCILSSFHATFNNKCNLLLLAISLFGIGTYGLVVWRVGFDNLLRVLPAFYILLCYFLNLFYKKIMQKLAHTDCLNPGFNFKVFILSIPVLILPALLIVKFNFYHGFYAGSIGELRKNHVYISLEKAHVFANPMEAIWINEIVTYIRETTTKDDPIFALPLNPIWYFLSERDNPTSYDWVLPQTIKLLGTEQKIIDQLQSNFPKIIIYADIAIDGREERRLSYYAPELYKFIVNNYYLTKITGPFQILKRKSENNVDF